MVTKRSAIALALFVASVFGAERSSAQDARTLSRFEYSGPALAGILELAKQEKIPIGLVCRSDAGLSHPLDLKIEHTSVPELLDNILGNLPGMEWRQERGVIHIYPKALSKKERQFLALKPKHFYSPSSSAELVDQSLHAQIAKTQQHQRAVGGVISILSTPSSDSTPFSMNGSTVVQILDHAVLNNHGTAGWVLRSDASSGDTWLLAPYPTLSGSTGDLCGAK